ncbi:MAG: OmpH family outer membrane protein [Bacteroidota bacterium]
MNRNIIAIAFVCLSSQAFSQANQLKVGVFDIDIMIQAMPTYSSTVDSALQAYAKDSLSQEYLFYQQEYTRVDSSYKIDSVLKKPQSVLDLKERQRQELAYNIINFQQIADQRLAIKRAWLARPLYEKVMAAYKRVLETQKYTLILKPNSYEMFSHVENVFVRVGKELNVALPKELSELK